MSKIIPTELWRDLVTTYRIHDEREKEFQERMLGLADAFDAAAPEQKREILDMRDQLVKEWHNFFTLKRVLLQRFPRYY